LVDDTRILGLVATGENTGHRNRRSHVIFLSFDVARGLRVRAKERPGERGARKPNATVEEVIAGMKELGAEPSTPSTIQTVRADLRHTLKVLLDNFDGRVPVRGL
jgi:hypothetical protein